MDEKRIEINIRIDSRTSKSGNPYKVLVLHFDNGYEYETFINKEEEFCIRGSIPR